MTSASHLTVLVRGSNDVASAVAHRLFRAGHAVLMHEAAQPTATRRGMSFTDAVFDGSAWLEGIEARRCDDLIQLPARLAAHEHIPLTTLGLPVLLEHLRPDVLIDARMRKHQQPEAQMTLAPLTIGLGPGFVAGETVHLAVETGWGERLGNFITRGAANPLEGEPKEIAGHARDRYVYAPHAGVFRTEYQIGERVAAEEVIAHIEATPLRAPIAGTLRGLTRDGVPVELKTKVIEIDPRLDRPQFTGISERPARIAEGALAALENYRRNE